MLSLTLKYQTFPEIQVNTAAMDGPRRPPSHCIQLKCQINSVIDLEEVGGMASVPQRCNVII